MKIAIRPAVYEVDIPLIRATVPVGSQKAVLSSIEAAIRTLPKREPLKHNLRGLYKCKFSSGMSAGEDDMRIAVFLNEETDTAEVWAVGFRDAYLPTDFYRLLRERLKVERGLGTPGARLIGKTTTRRRKR